MYRTKQFSTKAQYVTPLCKTTNLHARRAIMTGSPDPVGKINPSSGLYDLQDGYGVNDNSSDWGY